MSADTVFREAFSGVVRQFIENVYNDPDMALFSASLLAVLCLILIFVEIARFTLIGFEPEAIVKCVVTVFVSLTFYVSYEVIFDVVFETLDNLGLHILKIGTGTSDPLFLFKFVNHALMGMYQEEVSLWDMTVGDIVVYGLWKLIAFILTFVMFLIGTWAVWCLFLAKLLGVIFVPFIAHPVTRSLFDGWLKFTLGSLVLLVVVRISGVLAGLAIQAQFKASGILQCGGADLSTCLSLGGRKATFTTGDNMEIMVTMLMAILIVISSIGLSSSLVSGVSSPSGAVSIGASQLMKQAFKKFGSGGAA